MGKNKKQKTKKEDLQQSFVVCKELDMTQQVKDEQIEQFDETTTDSKEMDNAKSFSSLENNSQNQLQVNNNNNNNYSNESDSCTENLKQQKSVQDKKMQEKIDFILAQNALIDLEKIKQHYNDQKVQNKNENIMQQCKDLIILIGATGAGKTTLINFLVGNKIGYLNNQQVQQESRQNQQIQMDYLFSSDSDSAEEIGAENDQNNMILGVIEEHIKVGKIGYNQAESCTSQIQLYLVKLLEKILADTMGFQDSRGSELEIINKIKLINSIKKASNLRIVVLIDYRSIVAHKGKLYREIIEIINSLFDGKIIGDYKNFYSTHCIFFITHCHSGIQKINVIKDLKNLQENLKQQQELQGYELTQAIIQGFKENENYSFISRPVEDDYKKVWQNIIERVPLKNPQNYVKLQLSEDLQLKFEKYVYNIERLFKQYSEQKNFEAIKVLIDNLQYLHNLIGLKQIKEVTQNITKATQKQQNQTLYELLQFIKEQFVKHNQEIQNICINSLQEENCKQTQRSQFGIFQDSVLQKIGSYQRDLQFFNQTQQLVKVTLSLDYQNDNQQPQISLKSEIRKFLEDLIIEKKIIYFPEDLIQSIVVSVCIQVDLSQLKQIIPEFNTSQYEKLETYIINSLEQIKLNIFNMFYQIKQNIEIQQELRTSNICENNKNLVTKIYNQLTELQNINKVFQINNLKNYQQLSNQQIKEIQDFMANFMKELKKKIKTVLKGILDQNNQKLEQSQNQLIILFKLIEVISDKFIDFAEIYENQKQNLVQMLEKIHTNLSKYLQQEEDKINKNQQQYTQNIKSLQVLQDVCQQLFNEKYDYCHLIQEKLKNQIQIYSQSLQQQIEQNNDILYESHKLISIYKHIFDLQWVDELYQVDYSQAAIQKVLAFAIIQINLFQEQIEQVVQQDKIDLHKLADLYSKGITYKQILEINNQKKGDSGKLNIIQDDLDIISKQIDKMDEIFSQNMQFSLDQNQILEQVLKEKKQANFNWEVIIEAFQHLKSYKNLPIYSQQIKKIVDDFDLHMSNVINNSQKIIQDTIYFDNSQFLKKIQKDENLAQQISDSLKNIKYFQNIKQQFDNQQIFTFKNVDQSNVQHICYQVCQEQFTNFFKQLVKFYEQQIGAIVNTDIVINYDQMQKLYKVLQELVQNLAMDITSLKPVFDQIEPAKMKLSYKIKEIKDIFYDQSNDFQQIDQRLTENQEILKSEDFIEEKKYLQKTVKFILTQKVRELIDHINNYSVKIIEKQPLILQKAEQLKGFQQMITNHFTGIEIEGLIKEIHQAIQNLFKIQIQKYLNNLILKREFDQIDEILEDCQNFLDQFLQHLSEEQTRQNCQSILDQYQDPQFIIDKCGKFVEDCQQMLINNNQKSTLNSLNKAVQMNSTKFIQIRKYLGDQIKNTLNKQVSDLQQQQNTKKIQYKIDLLKQKMLQFNDMYPEDSIDYNTTCNQFKYQKEKILQKIKQIDTLQSTVRQEIIQQICDSLTQILNDCDETLPLYQEPVQLITNQIKKILQQIENQTFFKQQIQDIKNINHQDIIYNIDLLFDLKPLYEHSEMQRETVYKAIEQILQEFHKKVSKLLEQQFKILEKKIENNQEEEQKTSNSNKKISKKNSFEEQIIDTDALIIWYQGVLLAQQYSKIFYNLDYKNIAQDLIQLQKIIQEIYDNVDKKFKNDTQKSLYLANELKYFDQFIQFVKQNTNMCQQQQLQNYQNNQFQDNFVSNLKLFQEFCNQQQSSCIIKKQFEEKIDNLSNAFWNSFNTLNKTELKAVSRIICNLQKSSYQKLQYIFKDIKQKLQDQLTKITQNIVQNIDQYKFQEVQNEYLIINTTEDILYKNNFLDKKYSEDIINHFKKYLKGQQSTFEDFLRQVNEIKKNNQISQETIVKIQQEEQNQQNNQVNEGDQQQNQSQNDNQQQQEQQQQAQQDQQQQPDQVDQQNQDQQQKDEEQKKEEERQKRQQKIDNENQNIKNNIKQQKRLLKKIGKVLKYLQLITLNAPLLKQYVEGLIIDLFEYVKKNNYHYLKEIKQELLNDGTVSDIDQNSEDDDSESSENEGLQLQQNLLNGQDENQIQNQEVNNDLMKQMGMQLFQYPIFNKLRIQDYQLKYNSKQPQDVIKDFKFFLNDQQQNFEEKYLMENYDKLTKQFTRLREKYLNKDNIKNYREIAIEAQEIVKKIKDKKNDKKLGAINSELIINLLSKIFSIWSLQDITMDDIKNKEMTYQSPNVNQILSILIILNCHVKDGNFLIQIKNVFSSLLSNKNNDNKIMNHVQQIKTGEGKSVIIGVLSVFFALLGFNVHSVCYSQYLSQRDEKAFYKLFENFKVQDKIFYGTFQQLCKRILEQNIKLQDATLDLVQFGNNKNFQQQQINQQFDQKVPTILICDEIDVFFSQDFYGKTYKQIAQLKTPEICQLIKYIWQQGKPRPNQQSMKWQDILNNVQQQDVYQKIIQQHNHVKDIIEQEIIKACFQVTNFKDHNNYFVENQKIGYKLSDHTKSYDITYEYLTQFAYLKANEDDDEEMTMQSVDQAQSLNIVSGKISYAEVPLKYNLIFGVTGTLEELDNQMKKILKEKYEIKLKTLTPSIFNNSNLDFKFGNKDYFCIEPSQTELYNRIKALTHQKHQNKQAILIFFEDSKQLQAYYDSNYLAFPKEYYNVIDERTENKDDLIKLATLSKKITLLTKDYGRGTDFVCNSEEVKKNGGVVVIQVFFSNDPSEEAQIKGRTARQGEQGSYHIYLDQQVLYGQFDIDQQKVEQMINQGNAYEQLVQLRQQKLERQIKNLQDNLTTCNQKHEQTQKYISCLENKQNDAARAVLLQLNEDTTIKSMKVQICPEQHIIFMLDSSGSMSGKPWQDLMSAFENCIQIKQQSNQNHIVSVIYYESRAHLICNQVKITDAIQIIRNTPQRSGGTNFSSAFTECSKLLLNEYQQYQNYSKIIMFMTDGGAGDNFDAALQNLKQQFQNKIKRFQCQGFGQGANTQVLQKIANQFGQAGLFSQAIEKDQLQQQMIKFADIEVGYLG
ncbi:P-loop containing nucleoside triphosphate hydrolase [Pseudocohnilembus persalinus]|uniref:p-loop containing nucleoside triphosphate hydrolase n=1 Tax=Pseudocohnilembus persalinus TaxID=266149 RepID=A0A0V0QR31_PSEPJ|nr:P-loop containing nucleoside triphosphate hydrolase [Pseudocohnilembus persalinus]|eukprot:KRX04480.1 P-loop containing nucleoside triphosphate hydrolase [Pseudocohnilembus persalinus]